MKETSYDIHNIYYENKKLKSVIFKEAFSVRRLGKLRKGSHWTHFATIQRPIIKKFELFQYSAISSK